MFIVWLIAEAKKNPAIVDMFWPIGLVVSGFVYLGSDSINSRLCIIAIILLLWGLRLAGYLYFTRIKKGIYDKRYASLYYPSYLKQSISYLINYEVQACFIFILSSVFVFISAQNYSKLSKLDMLGIMLSLVGIGGEWVSDYQLELFKKNNHGKNKVCDVGLWYYSRHPNYFFDWLTWCGFALCGLSANYGWIGLVSPLLLYTIMSNMTGPITERNSVMSRGRAYLEYQKSTSMFFPWFKKKRL